MKKIISFFLFIFLGLIAIPAFAEVKFEIIYADEREGFHIPPEARKSLEEAVAEVFSWLDHDANVRIQVKPTASIDSGSGLASAQSNHRSETMIPGIYHTHLARKILFRESGWDYDAIIEVKFDGEDRYAYGDEVSSEKIDFKMLISHELTHALGFNSWIQEGNNVDLGRILEAAYLHYQGLEGEIKNDEYKKILKKLRDEGVSNDFILLNYNLMNIDGEALTYFDTFLVDKKINKVVDTEKLKFIREDLFKLEDNDDQKRLYFLLKKDDGYHAYGLNGMDASHFETGTPTVMQEGIASGPGIREWSTEERDIIEALGYKLKSAKKIKDLEGNE